MQKHQKYFAVTDDSGGLLPYFIAVRHAYRRTINFTSFSPTTHHGTCVFLQVANGTINEMVVRKGNEAVLRLMRILLYSYYVLFGSKGMKHILIDFRFFIISESTETSNTCLRVAQYIIFRKDQICFIMADHFLFSGLLLHVRIS